jgi:hypothetical protein
VRCRRAAGSEVGGGDGERVLPGVLAGLPERFALHPSVDADDDVVDLTDLVDDCLGGLRGVGCGPVDEVDCTFQISASASWDFRRCQRRRSRWFCRLRTTGLDAAIGKIAFQPWLNGLQPAHDVIELLQIHRAGRGANLAQHDADILRVVDYPQAGRIDLGAGRDRNTLACRRRRRGRRSARLGRQEIRPRYTEQPDGEHTDDTADDEREGRDPPARRSLDTPTHVRGSLFQIGASHLAPP